MESRYDDFYDYKKENIVCSKCNVPLEKGEVKLNYMGSGFPVELPICPKCKRVFIDERLVYGKMLQVEKALEDK